MTRPRLRHRLGIAALVTLGLIAGTTPAMADTSPPSGVPETVSSDALPTVQIDANGNVNGLLHDLPLAADVVVNSIQEHHRIDGLQRPLLPLFGDGKDLVRDPAYGAV